MQWQPQPRLSSDLQLAQQALQFFPFQLSLLVSLYALWHVQWQQQPRLSSDRRFAQQTLELLTFRLVLLVEFFSL